MKNWRWPKIVTLAKLQIAEMSGREPERRKRIKDALARLSEGDAGSRERERIGALIAILLSIFGIIAIGALPVAQHLRIAFLVVSFCFAAVVGLSVKRWLDDRNDK